ncbi:MAG: flagellar hook-length control protein FliK [Hyphomonas sp.]
MNFVLDMDIRSIAPALAQEAAPTNLAPTSGGRAFAENFEALFNSADAPLTFSPDTAAPLLPGFTLIEPHTENAQQADLHLAPNSAPQPFQALEAEPDLVRADMQAPVSDTLLVPAVIETVQMQPSSESDLATAGITETSQAPSDQPEKPSPPENLLIPAAIAEPIIRQALSVREPQSGLKQAAMPDGQGIELPTTPAAASAPPKSNSSPAADAFASLPAEPIQAVPADGITAVTEPARGDSQPPQPAPAAALSIAPAPTQVMAPIPTVAAAPVAQAVLVALPSELPDIVTRAIQDKPADRITVQLDPPELGRVSIDFRFEGQTLQHVTVTAETPEAIRQLRLMHGELLEALEQNGLGQKDMTFQQQTPQERQEQAFAEAAKGRAGNPLNAPHPAILSIPTQTAQQPGRLDIRL